MSEYSEKFNALSIEQRLMVNVLMLEAEIRLVEKEKRRLASEHAVAIAAHDERIRRMKNHLKALKVAP